MSESTSRFTEEQIAAARLRVAADRKLGRPTEPAVAAAAQARPSVERRRVQRTA